MNNIKTLYVFGFFLHVKEIKDGVCLTRVDPYTDEEKLISKGINLADALRELYYSIDADREAKHLSWPLTAMVESRGKYLTTRKKLSTKHFPYKSPK